MARKKKEETKVLTPEEIRVASIKQGLEDIEREKPFINPPTYKFTVGDKVSYGAIRDCTIEEIYEDGLYYLLRGVVTNRNYGNPYDSIEYRVASWTSIRPIENKNSNLAKNQGIRLNYCNSTIESLIHRYYHFGVDMNPEYQRDYVWEDNDKVYLIDSIFNNIDIGKFVFIHISDEQWLKTRIGYEILDGKQRLSTLIEFYENRFPYQGYYYNDLSAADKRIFKEHNVVYADVRETDKKTVYQYFLMLNRCGKQMDKSQLELVEKLYNSIKN